MIHTKILGLLAVCFLGFGIGLAGAEGRTIEIHAHRYAFTPAEITVKKGETVHLRLFSDDVPHSLLIKDLGVNQTIAKGRRKAIEERKERLITEKARPRRCGAHNPCRAAS